MHGDSTQDSTHDEAQAIDSRMSHVTVTINGRQYRMACQDGEEDHLSELAAGLNERVDQLRISFGEIGDNRLVVMAALMVADELSEAKKRIGRIEEEMGGMRDARVAAAGRSQSTQAAVVAALNAAAERIERVTRGLNQSLTEGVGIG
jgi:cell division protein ZapA